MSSRLKLAAGIATAGRRDLLIENLRELSRQTRLPDCVIISPAADGDCDKSAADSLPFPLILARGRRGLPAQRNAILDAAHTFDILVFFDDDFFAAPNYLAELESCFYEDPAIIAMSGKLIADGVTGPGMDADRARAILASSKVPPQTDFITDVYNAYGCNMAVRLAPIRAQGLRFDESLPLYGWLEDVDFSRQLAAYGRIVKNQRMAGVHLGVKGGRVSGVKFGYSQIANPIYLWRKGTLRLDLAMRQMSRNLLANSAKIFWPEPWTDRRGRLLGNLLGFLDLLRGYLHPARILELD
ncbi:MAG: glycosyltransferase family 2 protein [Methylocapsa sp.]|nr:glycosyltransferase family 2 protein [Methylocapsa sp.]